MAISIQDIHKSYGRYPALNGVSLEVEPGELLALVTLGAKLFLEWRHADELAATRRH